MCVCALREMVERQILNPNKELTKAALDNVIMKKYARLWAK